MAEQDRPRANGFAGDPTRRESDRETPRTAGASTGRWRFADAVEAARHLGSAPR